jgi:hypothetical protein
MKRKGINLEDLSIAENNRTRREEMELGAGESELKTVLIVIRFR